MQCVPDKLQLVVSMCQHGVEQLHVLEQVNGDTLTGGGGVGEEEEIG